MANLQSKSLSTLKKPARGSLSPLKVKNSPRITREDHRGNTEQLIVTKENQSVPREGGHYLKIDIELSSVSHDDTQCLKKYLCNKNQNQRQSTLDLVIEMMKCCADKVSDTES